MFYPNLGFLFTEVPLKERFVAAHKSGFSIVECPDPYGIHTEELDDLLRQAAVKILSINTPVGDVKKGEFGFAGIPGKTELFLEHWRTALKYAIAFDIKKIHVTAGVLTADHDKAQAIRTYVQNIKSIAPDAHKHGITLLLEPINSRDKPGYLVADSDTVVSLIEEINEPNVKLLFDVYHIQVMEGDLITRLRKYAPYIGHVQIAAVPSRNEPDVGEVCYSEIFNVLREINYTDPVALEYVPKGETAEGLKWIKKFH